MCHECINILDDVLLIPGIYAFEHLLPNSVYTASALSKEFLSRTRCRLEFVKPNCSKLLQRLDSVPHRNRGIRYRDDFISFSLVCFMFYPG